MPQFRRPFYEPPMRERIHESAEQEKLSESWL
jgi:hypothetical protein